MFFTKKEEKIRITSREFCGTLSALLIPKLQKNMTLEEAWANIQWLFLDTDERTVFQSMLDRQFSSEALEWFHSCYRDHTFGGFKALFFIFHTLYDESPEVLADILTVFHVKIQVSHIHDAYGSEELHKYMYDLLKQRT